MKRTITEESILFASVIKWIVIASCTGIIVGLAATAFLGILSWSIARADQYAYTFLFLPLAFFISSLLTTYIAPDARGHGTEKVIEAIHKHASVIPAAVVPVKLLATVITLAVGGSAGKEGPCAQIGAGLASTFARLLGFNENDRRKLVICEPKNETDEFPLVLYLENDKRKVPILETTANGGEHEILIPSRIVTGDKFCDYYSLVAEWRPQNIAFKDKWGKNNGMEKYWLIASPDGGLEHSGRIFDYIDVKGRKCDLQKFLKEQEFYVELMRAIGQVADDSTFGKALSLMVKMGDISKLKGEEGLGIIHSLKSEHDCKVHGHEEKEKTACEHHWSDFRISGIGQMEIVEKKANFMDYLADIVMDATHINDIPSPPPELGFPDIKSEIKKLISKQLEMTSGVTAKGELVVVLKGDAKYRCTADYYPCYDVSAFLGDNQENKKIFGSAEIGEDSNISAVIDLNEFWNSKISGTMTYKEALREILTKSGIIDFKIPLKLNIKGEGDIMADWKADITREHFNKTDANGRPFELSGVKGDIGIEAKVYLYGVYDYELVSKPVKPKKEYYCYYLNQDFSIVKIDKKPKTNDLKFKKIIKSYSTQYAILPAIGEE